MLVKVIKVFLIIKSRKTHTNAVSIDKFVSLISSQKSKSQPDVSSGGTSELFG